MAKSVTRSKGRGDGFTLIELLVVIAIITLLLSVLIPALNKAKELGKRAVCLNHTRQLTLAWRLYADDNEGDIPQADVDRNATTYGWVTQKASTSVEDEIASIENGVLFPYTGFVSMYHCPSAKKEEFRSYSIVSSMNTPKNANNKQKGSVYTNLAEIDHSSELIVFVCEGEINKMDNSFSVLYDNAFWHHPGDKWGDVPPLTHNNGTTLSFVDGHSESWVWQDRDTILLAKGIITTGKQLGNPDLERVQRGIWGSLGYTPDPDAP